MKRKTLAVTIVAISRIEDQHYPDSTLTERVQAALIQQVTAWVSG